MYITINYSLSCSKGYYDSGVTNCAACYYKCATCVSSSTNCLSC